MDHCEWACARFGVKATNWLSTRDYWEAWSCRYRARGNKVHCLHIRKGFTYKDKNMSRLSIFLKTNPILSKWSSFNPVSKCWCLLQVLSPKDTKELTESCPEALAAAEEITKSAKSTEALSYLLGFSLKHPSLQSVSSSLVLAVLVMSLHFTTTYVVSLHGFRKFCNLQTKQWLHLYRHVLCIVHSIVDFLSSHTARPAICASLWGRMLSMRGTKGGPTRVSPVEELQCLKLLLLVWKPLRRSWIQTWHHLQLGCRQLFACFRNIFSFSSTCG